MPSLALNASFLVAVCAFSSAAWAQNTYRCGDSYSQTPCPGGVILDTADKRTHAQKVQTDKASQRDAQIADAMEKARLQQEAKDLAANTPALKPATPASAGKTGTRQAKKKNTPEMLTVKTAAAAKKKKTGKPGSEKRKAKKT